MQVQLKTGSGTIQDKDKNLMTLQEKLQQSENEVLDLTKKVNQCNENLTQMDLRRVREEESANRKINQIKESLALETDKNAQESEKNVLKATEEKEALEKEVDSLKEEIDHKAEELLAAKAEIVSLKGEKFVPSSHIKQSALNPLQLTTAPLGAGQLGDVNPMAVSVVRKETNGGAGVHIEPLQQVGPSSPKPRGVSSSKRPSLASLVDNIAGVMPVPNNLDKGQNRPSLVDNVAGVMPPPSNLDQAEDDSHIPQNENGPQGKKDVQDDDQNPDGQIDENVDLAKQHFLEEKTEKGETKDVVVEGRENDSRLNLLQESFNIGGGSDT